MLKPETLPRSVSAASLTCLLAVLGLAACGDMAPHRIDPDSAHQTNSSRQTDTKSYAQLISQQQRSAAQRVTPPPAQQQPAAAVPPPSAAAATPTPATATPLAATPPPANPDHPGTLAMVAASGDVLATRLRDPASSPIAAPSTPDTSASNIPEPPVVQVMRGDKEIRIPPSNPASASAPAAPAPPPAATPAAVATTAPVAVPAAAPVPQPKPSTPATKATPVATAANLPPAAVASTNPHAPSPPASAPPPPAPAPASSNALYGMPLPNLPALQNSGDDGKTQLAQADTSPTSAAGAGNSADAAQMELQSAQNRIGLSDEQLQQLQAGQDRIASGDNGGAYLILQSLNAQLRSEKRTYVVQGNESMWHVAGREEVYGNSYLWPLVWQANRDKVKKPSQLYKGMKLIIPAHPTAQEVAEALAYSKANNLEGMNKADSE